MKAIILTSIVVVSLTVSVALLITGKEQEFPEKVNGVSFVAPREFIAADDMAAIKSINADWVAIIPYAFSKPESGAVTFNHDRQWWGERTEGIIATINYARTHELKVMLKPHVWVRSQGWTGDFELTNEKQWQEWQSGYTNYMLTYAKIADSLNVEMLCIGTEYRKAVIRRPEFWKGLIGEIRKVYSGKLTYAANWDNYQNVHFWGDLDYIGIDAYFPLSTQKAPSVTELKTNWSSIINDLKDLSEMFNKPILFTEYGYQSIDYTNAGHWTYDQDTLNVNLKAQSHAYQALYQSVWKEPWFMGGFLWKWHADHDRYGGPECKRFTPQNKPVERVIYEWYKK